MRKFLIIGGGFAGTWALRTLRRGDPGAHITLLDPRPTFDFLPLLFDIIGKRCPPEALAVPHGDIAARHRAEFVNQPATAFEPEARIVRTPTGDLPYDACILACGAHTTFFGNDKLERISGTIDSVADTVAALREIEDHDYEWYVVVGGGYKGLELATHLQRHTRTTGRPTRTLVVEKLNGVLPRMDFWLQGYCAENLQRMDIEYRTGTVVEDAEPGAVKLSDGTVLENAKLFWTAGVEIPEFVKSLGCERTPQGRLMAGSDLQVAPGVFAAGDCANFIFRGCPLRMGVQFSIMEGRRAAQNALRLLQGRPLKRLRPVDLGQVLPMANNRSCGYALGLEIWGLPATVLHYFMCVYRSYRGNRRKVLRWLSGG